MSVYFNELTLDDSPAQNIMLLKAFRKVWAAFCSETDGKEKRILVDDQTLSRLSQAACDKGLCGDVELLQFVSTVMNRPYSKTDKTWPEEIRDRFLGSEYVINISPSRSPNCDTMGWAFLNGSITLGFQSSHIWNSLVHRISEKTIEGEEKKIDVLCVTKESHVKEREVQTWIACQRDFEKVELPPLCDLDPAQKKIHYRDDHGREILEEFSRRLVRCKYIEGVINSIPWSPHSEEFILGTRADGVVYICLHWYDEGYGLALQTTARGVRQTLLVADLIKKEFDQRT